MGSKVIIMILKCFFSVYREPVTGERTMGENDTDNGYSAYCFCVSQLKF